ncbi:MAG: OsmC family protein [Desulfovibrionaceae bacterium]|nr:OsmC family protein [Desulfovibrionaceae bacterium]
MAAISLEYCGDLHVSCVHEASGSRLITDAPVDNQGKGEGFSPTDLCATALASCAMTIVALYAEAHNLDVKGMKASVKKSMNAEPRRIGRLEVCLTMPAQHYTAAQKASIERCTRYCPVHLSLHPDIEQVFTFIWAD